MERETAKFIHTHFPILIRLRIYEPPRGRDKGLFVNDTSIFITKSVLKFQVWKIGKYWTVLLVKWKDEKVFVNIRYKSVHLYCIPIQTTIELSLHREPWNCFPPLLLIGGIVVVPHLPVAFLYQEVTDSTSFNPLLFSYHDHPLTNFQFFYALWCLYLVFYHKCLLELDYY